MIPVLSNAGISPARNGIVAWETSLARYSCVAQPLFILFVTCRRVIDFCFSALLQPCDYPVNLTWNKTACSCISNANDILQLQIQYGKDAALNSAQSTELTDWSGIMAWNNGFLVEKQSIQSAPGPGLNAVVKMCARTRRRSNNNNGQVRRCYWGCSKLARLLNSAW